MIKYQLLIKSRAGLSLQAVTDKNGRQVRRWVKQGAAAPPKGSKPASAQGNPKPGGIVKDKWGDAYTVVGPDKNDGNRLIVREVGSSHNVSIPLANLEQKETTSKPHDTETPAPGEKTEHAKRGDKPSDLWKKIQSQQARGGKSLEERGIDLSEDEWEGLAKKVGYDQDNEDHRVFFAGSHAGGIPKNINGLGSTLGLGDNHFGGIFATPDKEVAESHGIVRGFFSNKHIDADDFRSSLHYDDKSDVWQSALKEAAESFNHETLTEDELDELGEYVVDDKDVHDEEPEMGYDRLSDILGKSADDRGEMDWALQGIKGDVARRMGYSSVGMPDEHGESVLMLPGDGVISLDAAHDVLNDSGGAPMRKSLLIISRKATS